MRFQRDYGLGPAAGLLLGISIVLHGARWASAQTQGGAGSDAQLQAELTKDLDKKELRNVTVTVHNGHVVLSGTVDKLADKLEAEKRTHLKNRGDAESFEDNIVVDGPTVDDRTLGEKLATKVEYDRVGYGTTIFNAITVSVQNGVVTLAGSAYGPPDRDSAVGLVANYPGVKGLIDHINVDPVSPNDDRIRIATARAIYGYGPLQLYGQDPGKPIRIAVKNGNVTLLGVVNSSGDKQLAYTRANGVPGVFHVTDLLQVAGKNEH
jgi:osmotically-inducible protein OsmY